jgi:hypothetical protein
MGFQNSTGTKGITADFHRVGYLIPAYTCSAFEGLKSSFMGFKVIAVQEKEIDPFEFRPERVRITTHFICLASEILGSVL